jgi:uncharacterized membrane protein YdjX (TVP38/TMEM64 family)
MAWNAGVASGEASAERSRLRVCWLVLKWAAALGCLGGLAYLLWNAWDYQAFRAWKNSAGALRFFGVMAVLPALGVPVSPFFVVAGATFGTRTGLIGALLAIGMNLVICHWIAASGLRPWIAKLLHRFGQQLPDFAEEGRGALRFALLVKMTPGVPAAAKNYLLGMAGVPFPLYFAVSFLITGSFGVALVLLGESLFEHDLTHLAIAAATLLVLAFAWWWWRRSEARAPSRD